MSEQPALFSMEPIKQPEVFPPEILVLGDLLHDAGLHQDANDLLELHRGYAGGLEYYNSLIAPDETTAQA